MQKKFFAMGNLFFCVVILFAFCGQAFASKCVRNETVSNSSLNVSVHKLVSRICYFNDNTGFVTTEIFLKKNGKKQIIRNSFEGVAYSVSVDENIDINSDGIPDLAISNGTGRGGDGFNYWWYDSRSMLYKKIGGFGRLQMDKMQSGLFFYLVSSSDEYYSARYNYVFQNGSLKLKSVYGFKSCSGNLECTEIVVLDGGTQKGLKKTLTAKEVDECMAGTGACF
jgi:hypothetical protein